MQATYFVPDDSSGRAGLRFATYLESLGAGARILSLSGGCYLVSADDAPVALETRGCDATGRWTATLHGRNGTDDPSGTRYVETPDQFRARLARRS